MITRKESLIFILFSFVTPLVIQSQPGWYDSLGRSCDDYRTLQYCTNGTYGDGWKIEWGIFSFFADDDGIYASQRCCDCMLPGYSAEFNQMNCGYDNYENNIESLNQTHRDRWVDKNGAFCWHYETLNWCDNGTYGDGWLPIFGSFDTIKNPYNGLAANEICCSCMDDASDLYHETNCPEYLSSWKDSEYNTCSEYTRKGWCVDGLTGDSWREDLWGPIAHRSDNFGNHAHDQCCDCVPRNDTLYVTQCNGTLQNYTLVITETPGDSIADQDQNLINNDIARFTKVGIESERYAYELIIIFSFAFIGFVTVFMMCRIYRPSRHADYTVIFLLFFSIFDVVADILFMYIINELYPNDEATERARTMCVSTAVANGITGFFIMFLEVNFGTTDFIVWFHTRISVVVIVSIFSMLNAQNVKILSSRIGKHDVFAAPFSKSTKTRLQLCGVVSVVLQNIPLCSLKLEMLSTGVLGRGNVFLYLSLTVSSVMILFCIYNHIMFWLLFCCKTKFQKRRVSIVPVANNTVLNFRHIGTIVASNNNNRINGPPTCETLRKSNPEGNTPSVRSKTFYNHSNDTAKINPAANDTTTTSIRNEHEPAPIGSNGPYGISSSGSHKNDYHKSRSNTIEREKTIQSTPRKEELLQIGDRVRAE